MEQLIEDALRELAATSSIRSYLANTRLNDLCRELAAKLTEKGLAVDSE